MLKETWKQIGSPFQARYEVSDCGRVRDTLRNRKCSLTRSTLQGKPAYVKTSLVLETGERKLMSVHRLVAMAFIPGDPRMDVNHRDMDKTNNQVDNLEWVTHSENICHGMANNVEWKERLARAGAKRRKPIVRTDDLGVSIRYQSSAEAGQALGHRNKAGNICNAIMMGRKSYGYSWAYATE